LLRWALLGGVWLTAVAGIILKLLLPVALIVLAVVLYLLLGWSSAVVYEPVVTALRSLGIWLLAAGGASTPWASSSMRGGVCDFQNAIWHAFVLAAAFCVGEWVDLNGNNAPVALRCAA